MLSKALKQASEAKAPSLSAYLVKQSGQAGVTAGGTSATTASGTKVIPGSKIPQTVYTAADIQDTVDATAQKLIGRKPTADEVQGVLAIMNTATGAQAQAKGAIDLASQQQNAAASGANVVTGGSAAVNAAIAQAAQENGVPLNLAMAIAQQESGLNPQSVGDQGTSFGLYQLHQGGELGSLTQAQAFDPLTNARVALAQVGAVLRANPGMDPGQAAAAAQRPANRAAYAAGVDAILGSSGGAAAPAATGGGVSSPVGQGLQQGRVDQGVDYSGKGTVNSTGAGTVVHVQTSGWGSLGNAGLGALIAVKLDNAPDPSHSVVYYAENIIPSVKVGQKVAAGAVLGQATGQGGGIEIGWADPNNPTNPLAPLNKANTGAPTTQGQSFASYVSGGSQATGGATDVLSQPVIGAVPADPSQSEAAANFFETQRSPEYQANNLLNVFDVIQQRLGANAARRRAVLMSVPPRWR